MNTNEADDMNFNTLRTIQLGERAASDPVTKPNVMEMRRIFRLPRVSAKYPHTCDVAIIPVMQKKKQ